MATNWWSPSEILANPRPMCILIDAVLSRLRWLQMYSNRLDLQSYSIAEFNMPATPSRLNSLGTPSRAQYMNRPIGIASTSVLSDLR